VGLRGLQRLGEKKWRQYVADVVEQLTAALEPDDVVLSGGNVKLLKKLPPLCGEGANSNAFLGGFRLWGERADHVPADLRKPTRLPTPLTRRTQKEEKESKRSMNMAARLKTQTR